MHHDVGPPDRELRRRTQAETGARRAVAIDEGR